MPGMIALDGCRVVCVYSDGYVYSNGESDGYQELAETDCSIPDLTDPATIGCLFALVREAHGDPEIVVSKYEYSDGWTIGTQLEWEGIHSLWGSDGSIWGWSEAEVLVRALEVAP
jgi:hypothetical protein